MIKTRLMKLLKGSEKYIIQNILWQWIALLFQIAAIFAAGTFLQSLMTGALNQGIWIRTAVIAVLSLLVRFGCEKMAAIASGKASSDVKLVLRRQIYEKLLRIGASYKEKVPTSEVVHGNHRRGGTVGDLLWKISSTVVLQPSGSGHTVSCAGSCQPKGKPHSSDLCAADSGIHCGGAEICQKTAE